MNISNYKIQQTYIFSFFSKQANEIIGKLQDANRKENRKVKTGCDVIQAQEEVVKNKEAELENTRKQLKEKSEGLSLKEAEFIDLEKVRIDINIFF